MSIKGNISLLADPHQVKGSEIGKDSVKEEKPSAVEDT